MAKKGKEAIPDPNNAPNKDILQRLNFLYQASTYLAGLSSSREQCSQKPIQEDTLKGNSTSVTTRELTVKAESKSAIKKKVSTRDLSRSYVKSMRTIGQKTNIRM